ncbi:cytochrome P460 family protein [Methanolobus mangrovi]|uniref:Cytochrome P460 family protein n=1 Tax=Methanolobus mangrovi TaxID=3072977 RepID=A0AA51YGJ1_9EURY|nr:cytochrome P460 family protein [Methanolobus mangrovi]WMW22111.1 cytochrome P460 family protein [Methanolobus mangrovi]
MKIRTIILLMVICIVGISGCTDSATEGDVVSQDAEETANGGVDMQVSQPDASSLFSAFTENDAYKGWSIWPGKEAMMEGNGVHGDYVSIYVSDNALSSAEIGGATMPYETMVVKEGFNADKELTGIYLMYKSEGFNPENNDWFWAAYSSEGDVKTEGRASGCIGCHEGKEDVDYIFMNA